jgi:hypothetical protein
MFSAVLHTYRNSQGAWLTTPDTISVPRQIAGFTEAMHGPTIAFASDGTYAFWFEYSLTQDHGVMYNYCANEGSTWGDPAWLTSDPSGDYWDEFPYPAVDEAVGAIHVVWGRYLPGHGSTSQIWWRNKSLGGGGGQAQRTALSRSSIELFPNPAKAGRVTVRYSLPRAKPLRVTLLDVSGRAVRTQEFAASERGSAAIDASGLNAGVYVVKLDAGATSLTRKLVIE